MPPRLLEPPKGSSYYATLPAAHLKGHATSPRDPTWLSEKGPFWRGPFLQRQAASPWRLGPLASERQPTDRRLNGKTAPSNLQPSVPWGKRQEASGRTDRCGAAQSRKLHQLIATNTPDPATGSPWPRNSIHPYQEEKRGSGPGAPADLSPLPWRSSPRRDWYLYDSTYPITRVSDKCQGKRPCWKHTADGTSQVSPARSQEMSRNISDRHPCPLYYNPVRAVTLNERRTGPRSPSALHVFFVGICV